MSHRRESQQEQLFSTLISVMWRNCLLSVFLLHNFGRPPRVALNKDKRPTVYQQRRTGCCGSPDSLCIVHTAFYRLSKQDVLILTCNASLRARDFHIIAWSHNRAHVQSCTCTGFMHVTRITRCLSCSQSDFPNVYTYVRTLTCSAACLLRSYVLRSLSWLFTGAGDCIVTVNNITILMS